MVRAEAKFAWHLKRGQKIYGAISHRELRLLAELGTGLYRPTITEILITLALFSGMFLLYAVFTRFFPIIPVWETAEDPIERHAQQPVTSQA